MKGRTMLQQPFHTLALCLLALVVMASAQTQRYEFKHSFRSPFYLGRGGTLPFWEFGGSAIVSEDRIRLTPALQGRVGWVWNTVPADMESWEVQAEFEIGGGGSLGADGMALWYIAEPKHEGIAMGSKDEFQGLAIFLDTFDNDGQNDNPRISLWVNDGTQRYEPFDDGRHGEKGSCRALSRESRAKLRVIYRDSLIQLETDAGGSGWQPCASYAATLPKGYYFGLSAATGHLTDNHDVFSFITYNLDPWRRRAPPAAAPSRPADPEPEPVRQTEPEAEPVKPNPYLPKDPPNPYLPQQEAPSPQRNEESQPPRQEQEPQRQAPPPPPPREPERVENRRQETNAPADSRAATDLIEKLFIKLDSMRTQQDLLTHAVTRLMDKVEALEQRRQPADNTDDVRATLQQVRDISSAVQDLRKLRNEDSSQVSKSISDLKSHISTEQGNVYTNVARLVRELQQNVGALQTVVERGDRDQNNALAELRNSKEELKSVVESSSSVSWWVYFAFFQLCFGVGFAMWKKARDDANKKFL